MGSWSGTVANLIRPKRKRPERIERMWIDHMRIAHMRNDPFLSAMFTPTVGRRPEGGSLTEHDSPTELPQPSVPAGGTSDSEYLDIPDDAGRYRDALTTVLLRIPDGWSRSISCGPGWYPMIAELHLKLSRIDVDYDVLQVKEKYGTLRYYARTHTDDSMILDIFDALIEEAESRSVQICELCGGPGQLSASENLGERHYKTLCRGCRDASELRGNTFNAV